VRVEVSCAESGAVIRDALIEAAIDADRLFRAQGWIPETREARLREGAGAKPLKQCRCAKPVADVRA